MKQVPKFRPSCDTTRFGQFVEFVPLRVSIVTSSSGAQNGSCIANNLLPHGMSHGTDASSDEAVLQECWFTNCEKYL